MSSRSFQKRKAPPKEYIENFAQSAADKLFGPKAATLSARHTKVLQAGTVSHIDYTVPCFELAASVGKRPNDVAEALAKHMRSAQHQDILFDATSGYINFSLSDTWLEQAILAAADWLDNPGANTQRRVLELISFGPPEANSDKILPQDILSTGLVDLYELAGWTIDYRILVQDASEQAVDLIASQIAKLAVDDFRRLSLRDVSLARLRVRVRRDMAGTQALQYSNESGVDLQELKDRYRHHETSKISEYGYSSPPAVISQIELAPQVHHHLNTMETSVHGNGLIRDTETQGAYYYTDSVEQGVPLRSSSGFLYEPAYLLGALNNSSESNDKTALTILLTPRGHHSFILDYADKHQIAPICIDPQEHLGIIDLITQTYNQRRLGPIIAHQLRQWADPLVIRDTAVRLSSIGVVDFVQHCQSTDINQPLMMLSRMLDIVSDVIDPDEFANQS